MCPPGGGSGSAGMRIPAGHRIVVGIMIELLVGAAALVGGYVTSKDFTKRKLRFVDVVHTRAAPWVAGAAVALLTAPVTLLPIITGGTVIALGAGVAFGVKSAQKERHLLGE